jgi:hypothetical protein
MAEFQQVGMNHGMHFIDTESDKANSYTLHKLFVRHYKIVMINL